ncbi:hypothetical protein JCM33374_g1969 [Metschnikowia sp. JCM 33374]|nr:hypothetical protein JCM33374_g1969 [Metschnikowia sp. JCM 33374]
MSANHSSCHIRPHSPVLQDEEPAVGDSSTRTWVPDVLLEHIADLDHPTSVTSSSATCPPEYAYSNMFQEILADDYIGQLTFLENEICPSIDRANYGSDLCYFNSELGVNAPVLQGMDTSKNTFTGENFLVNISGTPSPASTSGPDILKADGLKETSFLWEANVSATSTHTQLPDASTGRPRFVHEMGPVEALADVQKPDSAYVEDSPASPSPHSIDSVTRSNSSEHAQEAFTRLLPSLKTAHSGNFGTFLIEVLKETHDHVPLQDFYCMLYTNDSQEYIRTMEAKATDVTYPYGQKTLTGIKLQHLVLESFKSPDTFQNGLLKPSPLSSVNLHEFLRTFLAMKILFGSVKKVDDPLQTLPRLSIYKAYYIICQKLLLKYPDVSNNSGSLQYHILGQPKIGMLTKLIFPAMMWKRLGRRGQSKVHYIGLTWNESMVDHGIIGLVDHDLAQLSEYFKSKSQLARRNRITRLKDSEKNQEICYQMNQPPMVWLVKPLYTFVDLTSKYPSGDCSPRTWNATQNVVPPPSEWAKGTMERSVVILKCYGVNLDPLIANIFKVVFSGDDQSIIMDTVIYSIAVLLDGSCPQATFLHLYLAIILLIFPVIVASDQEVSTFAKQQLRASVKNCVTKLEDDFSMLTCLDEPSLTTFIQVLRKMTHISEMTSSRSSSSHAEGVFKEMAHDIKSLTSNVSECGDMSRCEELFTKGTINAFNAYSYELMANSLIASEMANVTNINNIGKAFQKVALVATQAMSSTTSGVTDAELYNDVPYQLFHRSAKRFHEVTLSFPEISQLPIPVITSIISYYTNEMHQVSFGEFARRGPDLSKETFKCWWIYSALCQEYMGVISEVVALSQALA